ncbi:MAG: hypothetical protein LBH59_08995 [Planctomycetaceae bacterium]|nr:hypothetical protein [Planctomycetaceae bacterium]
MRGKNTTEEFAENVKKEYADFPEVKNALAEFYQKKKQPDRIIDLIKDDYTNKLTQYIQENLVQLYLSRNEPEKAIDILEKFLQTNESKEALLQYNVRQKIGFILLQEGKIKEAESHLIPAMRVYSSWGLTGMAQYKEITGEFHDAEELFRADFQSYPENRYKELWGFLYRTNNTGQQKIMNEILDRYSRYKSANLMDTRTLMSNIMTNKEVIFPCYCMDIPFPQSMGKEPLVDEFLRDGNGYLGMLAWLDAMKQKDQKQANRLLLYLRELWFLHDKNDPFVEMQRKVLPRLSKRIYVNEYVRMLAALFAADQKTQKPRGSFREDELDFLIRSAFVDDLQSYNAAAFLCFAIGRYKDLYGEKEQAIDYYRRVLGFRVRFDSYVRSLAVKELRKQGLTNEEYVKWSQADPKVRKNNISETSVDVFCRQLFRNYSDSPSSTILSKPPAEKINSATDFGKTIPLQSGWYKVTKILFRGHLIADEKDAEKNSVVYWRIPQEGDTKEDSTKDSQWADSGIAHNGNYETVLQSHLESGFYSVSLGVSGDDLLSALASFHRNGQMALVISLNPNESPQNMTPESTSNCVRIEMKKVAELPISEPFFSATEIQNMTLPNDNAISDKFNMIYYAAIITASIALVLAFIISVTKKKRQKSDKTK